MKKVILILLLITSVHLSAQQTWEVLVEQPGEKSLKGIISREVLLSEASFTWYAESLKGFTPRQDLVAALTAQKDSIQLLVFMGTWCEDSHFIIPKLFATTAAAGFPDSHITLVGVDRAKKTSSNLCAALDVKNVPTIIVLRNGKELGRVVEYGKYGLFDKELAEVAGR